jgi:hypothetical protein
MLEKITAIVMLLAALSVASERLVETIKNLAYNAPRIEGWFEANERAKGVVLNVLTIGAGCLTAVLAAPALPAGLIDTSSPWVVVGLGLLASGGSSMWHSVLGYLTGVKEAKEAIGRELRQEDAQRRSAARLARQRPV